MALAACAALGLSSTAAASTPAALPTVSKTLAGKRGACATSVYRAPMAGYVSARLRGASNSDWDLVAVDRASGRRIATSRAFRSNELVQTWATAGQRIALTACHVSGPANRVPLSIRFVDVSPPKPGATVSVVRVHGSAAQIGELEKLGLDVTESRGAGWADVLVAGSKQLAIVDRLGLRHVTRVADLDAYSARSARADAAYTASLDGAASPLPSGRSAYRTYDDVQADLKALVEKHPDLVRPVTIGKTFQGRDITGVEIANDVNGADGRPTFFLMGEHHAREWPSEEIAMEYAFLLANPGADTRLLNVLAKERTVIIPVVNIDGFISTHTMSQADPKDNLSAGDPDDSAGAQGTLELGEAVAPPGGIFAYRRKNCDGQVPDGSFPCELEYGVDNNRNYGNLWGGSGSSQDPTSQAYHGPSPRSEPETQAVWNYTRTHQVTGLISLHTIAALVLRPPGLASSGLSPDEKAMHDLGKAMAKATGYTNQYGFQLYDTAGTTEDDTYSATGGYGYTIEIGPAGGLFHMPYETGVVQQWVKGDKRGTGGMREALLLMAENVADPHHHAIISGSAPAGAKLTLSKSFDTTTSAWCDMGVDPVVSVAELPGPVACPQGEQKPLTLKDAIDTSTTVPASGRFEWHVNQSTRPFVGGGATLLKLHDRPTKELTFTGGGPDPDGNKPTKGSQDHEFVVPEGAQPRVIKIDVSWGTPEDYDLQVYRKLADGDLEPVGSSGNQPGIPESTQLTGDQTEPGTYIVRVVNFAAAVGTWTAKVGFYDADETITTGHPEAYTMTCTPPGGAPVSRSVIIARGQSLSLDPCSPEGAGTTVTPDTTGSSVAHKKHTTKKARKVTKAQVAKAKRACAKAKRAARHKHGKKAKAKAKRKAKASCAKAAKLAKQYRKQHPAKHRPSKRH